MQKYNPLFVAGFGALLTLGAWVWSIESAKDPNLIGANIGAGILGISGFLVAIAGLIWFWDSYRHGG